MDNKSNDNNKDNHLGNMVTSGASTVGDTDTVSKPTVVLKDNSQSTTIYSIFHTLMVFVAIYLSFRCNDNKFNATSFVVALFCPYIYIIYVLATKGTCSK
jgi:hypothetical protein